MSSDNKSKSITIIREYNAPVKLVWEAWSDPKQVAKWWGPRGFTITTHSKELKVGGHWSYTMHGPDGVNYPNKTVYYEVEKHSRLVYDHGGNDDQPPLFRVTANFSEKNGKTTLEMTMDFESSEKVAEVKKIIKLANGNSTWDRLAEYLEKEISGKEKFIINRSFDVPIEFMFKMWTDEKHILKWLSPTGTEMKYHTANIKTGESSFYSMYGKDLNLHGKCQYIEIKPPVKIVYTQQFCDENMKTVRHSMAPTWPESMLTMVTFAEESPTSTRVSIEWEPHGACTIEEIETFVKSRNGMMMGWTGSLDKLETYLLEKK